ncbi:MAG: hypothetical protein IT310_01790 [Anaerolineales bacterium]|nr:hypothetical protein [Anaerolineales bacterium]
MACLLFGLFNDLSTQNPEYGKDFNPEREKMGIPIIPENWELRDVLGNRITWGYPEYPPSEHPIRPYYSQKQIVIVDENTIEETDYYEGARMITTLVGDHLYDSLDITCTYHLDSIQEVKCTALFSAGGYIIPKTYEEAIAILGEWGLPYP